MKFHSLLILKEADGLGKNSVDMGYQLQKIGNEWKEYSVLIEQYIRSLDMMGREVSQLPSAKGSRRAALRSVDEALAETERIAAKVSEMVSRIELELRMKGHNSMENNLA